MSMRGLHTNSCSGECTAQGSYAVEESSAPAFTGAWVLSGPRLHLQWDTVLFEASVLLEAQQLLQVSRTCASKDSCHLNTSNYRFLGPASPESCSGCARVVVSVPAVL